MPREGPYLLVSKCKYHYWWLGWLAKILKAACRLWPSRGFLSKGIVKIRGGLLPALLNLDQDPGPSKWRSFSWLQISRPRCRCIEMQLIGRGKSVGSVSGHLNARCDYNQTAGLKLDTAWAQSPKVTTAGSEWAEWSLGNWTDCGRGQWSLPYCTLNLCWRKCMCEIFT